MGWFEENSQNTMSLQTSKCKGESLHECLEPSLGSNMIEYPVQNNKARSKNVPSAMFEQDKHVLWWRIKKSWRKTWWKHVFFALLCFSMLQLISSFMFFSFTFSWIGSYHVPCLPASFSGCPLSHAGRCWHQSQGWSAGRRPRRPPKSKTWRRIAHGAGHSHGWEMAPPAMLLDVWSFRIPHLQMPKEGLECVKDVRPNPDVAPHLQSSSSSSPSH